MALAPAIDFRSVFDGQFSYVWNTLRRLGVREADLKDQTQEVFLAVHQLFDDYDNSRPIRPWLFGISYRYALRYRALARHKREAFEAPPDPPSNEVPADERLVALQARGLVLEAIETIDLPYRAVFVMAEVDEVPITDVARALGIPLNTAYSRLRLARQQFAAAVARIRTRRSVP